LIILAGFFVNRCLAPFMVEVTALVQEGVDLPSMDKAMRAFGMPVGPITLSGTAVTTNLISSRIQNDYCLKLQFTVTLKSLRCIIFTLKYKGK
jgi:3-hydroxyacyl-CoA dehydrogenase